MITGGSTTDDTFSNQKSWPSFLSKILKERKLSHVIYNGGIVGYNSSQELLKTIRDINILKPHIVISYSGINDFYRGTNDFIHPYIPLHISKNIIPNTRGVQPSKGYQPYLKFYPFHSYFAILEVSSNTRKA